jgi:hypothetical protein
MLSAVLLSGCWTVPVVPDFPRLPEQTVMNIACPTLEQLKADPTISELSNTLNTNYHKYYECAVKVDSWNAWYKQQRDLYEKTVKK